MTLFTLAEFKTKYNEYVKLDIPSYKVEEASEMIFSQIGMRFRDNTWTSSTAPQPIKNACMEQLRFMIEHDLPFVDSTDLKAGSMQAKLKTDYSTLALRILANNGYWYRGNAMGQNMGLNIPFGG